MENNNELSPAEVLAFAGKRQNIKTQEFDAMENIPTLTVENRKGEGDIKKGTTLCGRFVTTERLVSAKFIHAPEKDAATGLPVQFRHVLENEGKKYAIWNSGELKVIFAKLQPGTYVELTYEGRITNSKGMEQHSFSVRVGEQA